mmetsp:Transcript_15495/g.34088  ORF Transcript_15495/g.34088 Transcript_15495/m.34088 type:complete len:231 (-) Transcript_15495:85-777(-)
MRRTSTSARTPRSGAAGSTRSKPAGAMHVAEVCAGRGRGAQRLLDPERWGTWMTTKISRCGSHSVSQISWSNAQASRAMCPLQIRRENGRCRKCATTSSVMASFDLRVRGESSGQSPLQPTGAPWRSALEPMRTTLGRPIGASPWLITLTSIRMRRVKRKPPSASGASFLRMRRYLGISLRSQHFQLRSPRRRGVVGALSWWPSSEADYCSSKFRRLVAALSSCRHRACC